MKLFSIFVSLMLFFGNVYSACSEDSDVTKTKKLYSCYLLYNATADAPNNPDKKKTLEIANNYLMKASLRAIRSGGEDEAKRLVREAADELHTSMTEISKIKNDSERNNRITGFMRSCRETLKSLDQPTNSPTSYSEALEKGDYEYALKLIMPLAEAGDARAQTNLGMLYSLGLGIQKDFAKAAYWTRKGAEAGNPKAQSNLGLIYFFGNGVEQDDKLAANWFGKAAAQGNGEAQISLGVMYLEGRGVTRDYEKARELFTASIKSGNTGAANNMAKMIEDGLGMPPDLKTALDLYEIAAKHGNPEAQNRIGLAYMKGEYRDKNRQVAKTWFRKSAEQGERYAMYHYGLLLLEDAPQNVVAALKWIALSAKQGYAPAQQKLDELRPSLTPKQQNGLNRIVDTWRPKGRGVFTQGVFVDSKGE